MTYLKTNHMNLQELKKQSPADLIAQAEKLGIENPSTLRKQEILFAILKKLAEKNEQISASGVLEVLQDGFGFLRAIESNYLPGPDDIYVSPSQIRRFGLRTGDTVEGEVRAPKDAERYFALLKVNKINFDEPEKGRNKIAFDNKSLNNIKKCLELYSSKESNHKCANCGFSSIRHFWQCPSCHQWSSINKSTLAKSKNDHYVV